MFEDKEDFCRRFSEISDELYRIAFIYLKNREDSRDVVQETAYRCFKERKKLKEIRYFKTWAIRIAINCSQDILKKRKRTVSIEDTGEDIAYLPSPEASADARILLEAILGELDEKEKTVLLLHELYGLSLKEISETVKIPLSTVKSVLYRTLKKLKKECFYDEG